MKNISKILTLIFTSSLLFTSCSKEQLNIDNGKSEEPMEFVEGRLHFESSEQLTKRVNELRGLDEIKLQDKMANLYKDGFKPLKPYYKESDIELKQEYE